VCFVADLLFFSFSIQGLKDVRFNYNNKGHPVAFADFIDAFSAESAMKALQGAPVGMARIRLTYAKKKDIATGQPAPASTDAEQDPDAEFGQF